LTDENIIRFGIAVRSPARIISSIEEAGAISKNYNI
jgi:hypothetical protein